VLNDLGKPQVVDTSVVQSSVGQERKKWEKAIYDELKSLVDVSGTLRKATVEEVQRYKERGMAIVPSRMVYVVKPAGEGTETFLKYKARLVVCGNWLAQVAFTGTYNLDAAAMRIILAWGFTRGLRIGTLDVKTAFLNAEIKGWEKIVIAPPPTLVKMGILVAGEFWVAEKALYGLKESPKAWEEERDASLATVRFELGTRAFSLLRSVTHRSIWLIVEHNNGPLNKKRGIEHPSYGNLPFLHAEEGTVVGAVGVYVDDFLFVAEMEVIETLIVKIRTFWDTSEGLVLGKDGCTEVTYLGVTLEVKEGSWDSLTELSLHQSSYAYMVGEKFQEQRPLAEKDTPGQPLHKEDGLRAEDVDPDGDVNLKYCQRALGSLLWLVTRTRPDMAWAYSAAATMVSLNTKKAADRVRHLLGYLIRTIEHGLVYRKKHVGLKHVDVFADASYAPTGRKSYGGMITYVKGCPVAWKSKWQTVTAMSTAESELIESAEAHVHARPVVLLLGEMAQRMETMFLECDNTAALSMVGDASLLAWKSRHISIRGASLDDAVRSGEVQYCYCSTTEQKADGLTKALSYQEHLRAMTAWCMTSAP
jgi:hypothetical protein